mmetsp:Transcript_89824/g.155604  ORF Transcript_89824/g.155604 Transcript_89824/m.155604 type:complete len:167 (-) Transcript_89824:1447-1947(-)
MLPSLLHGSGGPTDQLRGIDPFLPPPAFLLLLACLLKWESTPDPTWVLYNSSTKHLSAVTMLGTAPTMLDTTPFIPCTAPTMLRTNPRHTNYYPPLCGVPTPTMPGNNASMIGIDSHKARTRNILWSFAVTILNFDDLPTLRAPGCKPFLAHRSGFYIVCMCSLAH